MPRTQVQTAVIANGQTTSQALRIDPAMVTGIIMPAAFTGATITIEGCDTVDGQFNPIYDSDGNAVSLAVAADRNIGLSGAEADAVAAFPYIRLVSGSAEGADREVGVLTRL